MHPSEIELLNRYAAAELAAALIIGKHARLAEDPYLIARLTYHCMDEARHSWLWLEFMEKKGIPIQPTHGGINYFAEFPKTMDMIDFLAAVHVYELRVPFQFACHSEVSMISPDLRELVLRIRDDERHHLSWIRKYLQKLQKEGDERVAPAIKRAAEIEERTFLAFVEYMKNKDEYSKEFAEIVEAKLPSYEREWENFLPSRAE